MTNLKNNFPVLLAAFFFALSILLPNHNQPWLSFYQEASAFGGLLFLLVFLLVNSSFVFCNLSFASVTLFVLCFLPALQFFSGPFSNLEDLFLNTFYIAGFCIAVVAGFQISTIPAKKIMLSKGLAITLLLVAVISVWIAIRQWLSISGNYLIVDMKSGGRPFANFGQPNHLATFLCMALAGLVYIFEQKLIGRFSAAFLALFILFGLALTQSRTPWLGFLCAFIWWGWQYRRRVVALPPFILGFWIGLFALLVLLLPTINELLYLGGESVAERFEKAERLTIWTQFLLAIKEGGLWGYGWGQVGAAQLQVALDYPIGLRIDNTHNILIDLIIWNGPIIGLILIAILIIWLFCLAVRSKTLESSFALLFSGFLLVHGMVEYPLEYAYFLLPLGIMLGVAESESSTGIIVNNKLAKWLLGVSSLVGVLLLVQIWTEYQKIEAGFQQMRFDRANIGRPKPWANDSSIVLLTQLDARLRAAYVDINASITDDEVDSLCRVAHREPYPLELYRCGLAKGYRGDAGGAAREFLIIESLHRQRSFMWAYTELQKKSIESPELVSVLTEIDRVRPTIKLQYQPEIVGQ
ncbi:PglL family O-oligosaccharyltransferase [Cellvibrio sp. PSBB006]|uniref:PglL family O-oligosaccharyltransferase n=1 Tax=Cellvibrio sp. PSBB006 TaxID=1987723 RepID=UPI000B3B57C3|nr:O-antigen ligase family protein [Cellvibrio sp. PSBB006]ARU27418.1 hypothetical protein CBR65_08170 [Cellvibrio sp. PSBB006]